MTKIPDYWKWFPEARFGLFIHWGAYAAYGRGDPRGMAAWAAARGGSVYADGQSR
jgi:hypothetical protein